MKADKVQVGMNVRIPIGLKMDDKIVDTWQVAYVRTCYYFKDTASVGYYSLETKRYEYLEIPFDKLQPCKK